MKFEKNNKLMLATRPILLMANSSWYLYHYRSLLIKEISLENKLITMSPIDKSSKELSKKSIFLPWRIHRSNDLNFLALIFSFIKMLLLVRAIKPKLIHSHTLKTNLLASIVSCFYDIPCVISFAGMGYLSKSKGLKLNCFKFALNLISFFSSIKRNSRWSFSNNPYKSYFIFQNPKDLEIFNDCVKKFTIENKILIPGSGIPMRYFNKKIKFLNNNWLLKKTETISTDSITFIYCGRLISSKGIYIFLEIMKLFPNSKGLIFGDIDPSKKDSLSLADIRKLSSEYKNVTFKGNVKDPLLNLNMKFPILIMPSEYGEGVSRSILESLSKKIPVICSKTALSGIFNNKYLFFAELNLPNEYKKLVF